MEGHTEVAVEGAADVEAALQQGIAARATHATNMNEHSSRSHAIFTISLSLRRWRRLEVGGGSGGSGNDSEGESTADSGPEVSEVEEHLSAKMHLVDLAGSERIKKSGVQVRMEHEMTASPLCSGMQTFLTHVYSDCWICLAIVFFPSMGRLFLFLSVTRGAGGGLGIG